MKKQLWIVLIFALAAVITSVISVVAADNLSGKDKTFLKNTASSGMMEVQLGQLAQEKGQSADVKNFGARMVTDHGKANDELKALAQKKNLALPAQLERKHRSMADKLTKASTADFDKKYMHMMVKDHAKDVAYFKKASKKVKDPDLKAWAEKTLPVLEQHLQQAREVAQKVGAK